MSDPLESLATEAYFDLYRPEPRTERPTMTTVDDAVEAGARALSEHWRDMHTNGSLDRQRDLAGHAARAMWPILSAGLRELHRTVRVRDWDECYGCGALHCPTMRAIQRIDKELGL